MKKIFIMMLGLIFLTGCNQKSNEIKDNDKIKDAGIYLTDIYTSCISPEAGQYVRNTIFDDNNCESVIAFVARINNATNKTVVKMVWIHNNTNKTVLEKITTEDLSVNQYPTSSYVEPEGGFLIGKYTIKVYIDNNYYKSIEFTKN